MLQEGDYTVENKAVNRKYEHVTAIYWCVWTALYLAISLSTMRWDITWVVWPVAGVLYGALLAFLKIKIRKQSTNKRISRGNTAGVKKERNII